MKKLMSQPTRRRRKFRGAVRPRAGEGLVFRPSAGQSLGVELELLVLDPRTRDLAPGSVRLLEACAAEGVPGVTAELMQSMIEVKTGVCRDVAAVRGQLVPSLRRLHGVARSLGYGLALAGTHPFHQTSTSVVFPAERYARVLERLAWLAYQRVVFGLHVHVGVPGTVRGLALAHQCFGRLAWRDLVLPAVRLAAEGFAIDGALAVSLNRVVGTSPEFPELRRTYGKAGGTAMWRAGDRLVQKDLAWTLGLLAEEGPDAFYTGAIADRIVAEMRAGGGLVAAADLAAYRANADFPVHGAYRGYEVWAPPPPSSGGICLVQMLNVLENFDLRRRGRWSPETLHLILEAMRRAYRDRALHLGDPGFVETPAYLTGKEYARELACGIDPGRATPSEELAEGIPLAAEGDSTTHFSVIDRDGMAVANTYSLERAYGSRVVARGTGVLLNDEMLDFNWRPGVTGRDGTVGTAPNLIAPGKRMLSSQTPAVVTRDGKAALVTGSPGHRTIINTVLCVVLNVIEFGMDVRAAVDAPRLHHPWFPDVAWFEGTEEHAAAVAHLRAMGHTVRAARQGDAHTIGVDPQTGRYYGAADRRISGSAVGY